MISSNRTVPSSSPRIDGWCRSNLIVAFDTVKQSWWNLSGLMSIHVLSHKGIEIGDKVTAGFSCGLAFATSFPELLRSTFPVGVVSVVSVYVLVNSIHTSKPWSCSVSKQRFDHDFYTVTILMKTDLHIQDRTDFCIFKNPPSRSGCFLISRQRVLSTQVFQFLWSFFIKCNEEFVFNNLQTRIVLKQRSDLNFNSVTIFMMTNMNVQDSANFRIHTNPASRSSSRIVTRHRKFSLGPSASSVMKYCPLRQFSNQGWSIVSITSGRQIVVRIVARVLATSCPVAVHRYEGRH